MEIRFERSVLELYKLDSLQKLASYFNIPVRSRWTKADIIDAIMSLQEKNDNENNNVSARVKRIQKGVQNG